MSAYYNTLVEPFYHRPVGLDQYSAAGLQANQYLDSTGLSAEVFGRIAARDWERAVANPRVQTPQRVGPTEVADSAVVAEPLHEREIARPLDGAVAVLLATESVARRAAVRPVWITGLGSAIDAHLLTERTPARFDAGAIAARAAYRMAGVDDPLTFDIAEVSAASAAAELMTLEALGLAEHGKADALYEDTAPIDVNPSGGAIPADPIMATGLVRLAEASGLLGGWAPGADSTARSAIVHGAGGVGMQNHCVVTLEA